MFRAPTLHSLLSLLLLSAPALAVDKKDAKSAPTETPAAPTEPTASTITSCRQEIRYSWKKIPPPEAEPVNPRAKPAPTPDPELFAPREVTVLTLFEEGPNADEVKAKLAAMSPEALASAREQCHQTHETLGQCSVGKLGALSEELGRLDFETRRSVREKLIEDCEKRSGICLEAKLGTLDCSEKQEASPPPAAAPTPEAAKDPKKK